MSALSDIYLDPRNPGSFGGVKRLYKSQNIASLGEVRRYLSSTPAYTRHKQHYSRFRRRKVMVPCPNYLWQADLVFMQKYRRFNNGYLYILTVIDAFSRRAFAIPIERKTGAEVIRAFEKIFSAYPHKPVFLECDQGKEFFNNSFKKFLAKFKIRLYNNFSDFKACIVERFNQTLQKRLSKYFTYSGSYRYIHVLNDIVKSYNDTVHRTIGMRPIDVNLENQNDVWMRIYKDIYSIPCKKPNIRVGDLVRLSKLKQKFEKGFAPTFSSEVFLVSQALKTIPLTFKIRDMSNEELDGIFYEKELLKVII